MVQCGLKSCCPHSQQTNGGTRYHPYLPSISNGIFGTYLYSNISSLACVPQTDTHEMKEPSSVQSESGGFSLFRRKKVEYNFERRGPRNGAIENGRKYNVRLLREYTPSKFRCVCRFRSHFASLRCDYALGD